MYMIPGETLFLECCSCDHFNSPGATGVKVRLVHENNFGGEALILLLCIHGFQQETGIQERVEDVPSISVMTSRNQITATILNLHML